MLTNFRPGIDMPNIDKPAKGTLIQDYLDQIRTDPKRAAALEQARERYKICQDDYFYKRATWQYAFAWLPHRCFVTGRWLWLTQALRARAEWRRGDDHFVTEDRWFDRYEALLLKLKGIIE